MRLVVIGMAAISLAACDNGSVPSPAEREAGPVAAAEAAEASSPLVTLKGDGLSAGAESFYYAAGQTEVETALANELGDAARSGEMMECGAGPMASSDYPGGLTANFMDGSLVGWTLSETSEIITLEDGFGIGTTRAELEAMAGFAIIADSTLGEEFMVGDDIGGFFEEGTVSMLYAGTQCFFR